MNMEPYDVYRAYLALKLHFTTDKYDIIKQQGRVKASKQAFFKRSDLFAIRKISEVYSDNEIVDYMVANFISGDRWGGVFDESAKHNYVKWKRRLESITYTFGKDVDKIVERIGDSSNFQMVFDCKNNQHPIILMLYLKNDVSIETLVILNKLNNFVDLLDRALKDDLIWPDVSRIIKKYSPFLNFDKERYNDILRTRIGFS